MISKAPDMKNNVFIVPPLLYIDFNVVFKVLLGTKVEKFEGFEKTKIPNIIKIRDKTHDTTGLLMLTSVKYIIFL